MSSKEHIHQEKKILPLTEHGEMLTKQFQLNCNLPGHPGNKHLQKPAPPRNRRLTVRKFQPKIRNLLPVRNKKELKSKANKIHTDSVRETINSYPANRVLGTKPPNINNEEIKFSRNSRSKLSQLRSGFSSILNDYKHRIDENMPNICPKCHLTPHDTVHLFNCPANPTRLKPIHLWKAPARAADFLKLDEGIT